ncbi:MAG: YceD family protein [Desulfitobacteriaceae bacterium]
MKIDITHVRRMTGETVEYDLQDEWLPFDFGSENISFLAPVHVQLKVHNTGKLLFAQGTIEVELQVTCGRCLGEFSYPMHLDYEDKWIYAPVATEEEKETALLYEKDEIEIDPRILEHIVLALPMKFTCSPDCLGLCPVCGVDLNHSKCQCSQGGIDPRLADLAKLSLDH